MHSDLQGWGSYPISVRRCQADIDDTRQYKDELEKRSGDLFVADSSLTKLELLESLPGMGMLQVDVPNTLNRMTNVKEDPNASLVLKTAEELSAILTVHSN